ncbi:hypothetical protein V495_06313 [Pseudogymnoascus sp. VKM F-4514 (FW-929)]|nr:hypothetical protein V495_06313 [Pseudogymnoascus sp. VKM F-4514 (FW-929)]KFY56318.1 hypothetical protein V497_06389 [Pseudogymnoascus sp. VKM F-4516 (FW-969)]
MPHHESHSSHPNYGSYQQKIYLDGLKGNRPILTTDPHKWEGAAKAVLPASSYGYIAGAAGAGETMDANRVAFRKWSIIPRMLQDNTIRDLSVELFGTKYPSPVLVAPVGVNKIFHHEGECAVARAAAKCSVPYIMSTASSTPPEEIADASGRGACWFQLYWPPNEDNEITLSMLLRAKSAGFTTLVVTLDLWALSWRPKDLDNAYVPFYLGIGDAIGLTDPVFQKKWKDGLGKGKSVEDDFQNACMGWEKTVFSGNSHTWEDIQFLKENWGGPIVLKGIQSVEDAELAVKAGVDGIVVSNHGGRQYDGAVGSLGALPGIVDAVGDKLTILFDSGIRTGADIMKALALGAKAVLVGRPIFYGLAVSGEAGAEHVLRCILADLDMNMGLVGLKNLKQLSRKILTSEKAHRNPDDNMEATKSTRQISSVSTAELYNRWAKVYDTDGNILQTTDDISLPPLLTQFFSLLPPNGAKITELGCGTGRNTAKLLLPPYSTPLSTIHALDLSPSMLEIARQRCSAISAAAALGTPVPSTTFEVFDALSGNEPPNDACGVNGVLSTLVLEHLPLDVFFGSAKKLLAKEGGYLLLTNMHEEMGRRGQAGFVDVESGEKVRGVSFVYSIEEVVKEGRKWGFEVVGEVRERAVTEADLEVLGKRGAKWVGCKVWFGGVFRLSGGKAE